MLEQDIPCGKIRIVIEGLRGEERFASLFRREGIAASLYDRVSVAMLVSLDHGHLAEAN